MVAPKLRLIPGVVLLPLHSPLHVAEELASLDVMCGGKLVFGAGIGYREMEFRAFGTTLKQAGRRFEECLTAVKRLWTEDFVTMKASYFELDNANCTVLPVQKPMPPVWIGANIDVGIRRARAWRTRGSSIRTTSWRRLRGRWMSTSASLTRAASRSPPSSPWRAKCSSHARAKTRSAWRGHIWR